MKDSRKEILRVFLLEASDWLDSLDGALVDIEEDPSDRATIDQFMRVAHTLKGSAGIAELHSVVSLAHMIESTVEELREGQKQATPELFDVLSSALETLRQTFATVAEHGSDNIPDVAESLARLEGLKTGIEVFQLGADREQNSHQNEFELGEYDQIRLELQEKKGDSFFRIDVDLPKDYGDDIRTWAIRTAGAVKKLGTLISTAPQLSSPEECIDSGGIALLLAYAGDSDDLSASLRSSLSGSFRTLSFHRNVDPTPQRNEEQTAVLATDQTIRVEMSLLDDLMRLVGELMISRNMLTDEMTDFDRTQDGQNTFLREIANAAQQLGSLTTDLQNSIMRARMVPVARMFREFKRAVRRQNRNSDAHIRVESTGENIMLDKNIVDRLSAPLAALAASFSVPKENHDTSALLHVAAENQWNHVVICLSSPNAEPNGDEVYQVERILPELGGTISVQSAGHSTRDTSATTSETSISIVLPLTLSIVPVLLTEVGDELYAFPVQSVQEIISIERTAISSMGGVHVAELRDEPLVLLSLASYLDVPLATQSDSYHAIIIQRERFRFGIIVDQTVGIADVVIKPMTKRFANLTMFQGSAILGNFRIALIFNVENVLDELAVECVENSSSFRKFPLSIEATQSL